MTRGTVYWVRLGATKVPEFGKTRPGLVVSNSVQNSILDSVIVVPISSSPDEIWPLRVGVGDVTGQQSLAVLPGLRQVSKTRLGERIATLSARVMDRIDEALAVYLGE